MLALGGGGGSLPTCETLNTHGGLRPPDMEEGSPSRDPVHVAADSEGTRLCHSSG